jgi:hypothetical protein
MFARFCGFGPGHKSTRNITQVFRDDIQDAFGLTDNLEVAGDDAEDAELDVPGDGDGAGLVDLEMDEEDSEDSVGGEDDDLHDIEDEDRDEDEDDGDLDGLVDGPGYDAL